MSRNTVISSPDISGLDTLYNRFKALSGNETSSYDDFISFLSVESADRLLFLDQHCVWDMIDLGKTIVFKISPKA